MVRTDIFSEELTEAGSRRSPLLYAGINSFTMSRLQCLQLQDTQPADFVLVHAPSPVAFA